MSDLVKIKKDATISKLLDGFQRLENRIVSLEKDNFLLKKENEILQGRLSHYVNPKNSRNSSIPPSKDENRPRKNQSFRKSTGNKVGGQPGRKGYTLEMTISPDNVVELYPEFCSNCGFPLENVQAILNKSRQIAISKTKDVEQSHIKRGEITQPLEILLQKPPNKKYKELYTFYKRACRQRQKLFTFLFIKNVPPDNNASERAIRNIKVKQKISGQFKTQRAAQNFAMIRSVIDTTIKNGMNVMEAMSLIAKFPLNSTN